MRSVDKIKIKPNATVRDAMNVINSGALQIAMVVDDNCVLLGTITDGDIRRGLLGGISLDDEIHSIVYKTPLICSVNDPKEKIIQLAMSKKIHCIPVVDSNGLLVGIEQIDDLLLPVRHKNKVILMAGGLGTRLGELTKNTPKPMLQVGNKPILETIIEGFAKYGFSDVIISVNYLSHIIEEYFGNGENFGVNVEYVHEKERMGTAGALGLMKDRLDEPFFVMNGDILTNVNFAHLLDFHTEQNSVATMCVREYDFQVPYGVVNMQGTKIVSIEEKPIQKFFVSAGIYMLSPEVLSHIPDREFFDMPTLFERLIGEQKNALSFPIRDYWMDIGQVGDYKRANSEYDGVFE